MMDRGEIFYVSIIAGLAIGVIISCLVYLYSDTGLLNIQKAKAECEKSLPRDQECYIIAVPPSKD